MRREAPAPLPGSLDRAAHVDLAERGLEVSARRVALALLVGLVAAALANVFGQRTVAAGAGSDAARVELLAPAALRSGLVYQVVVRVEARRTLAEPAIVLERGWFDGATLNSVVPEVEQGERASGIAFRLDPLEEGDRAELRLELQVNPTTWGRRQQDAIVVDGTETVAVVDRTATVFP